MNIFKLSRKEIRDEIWNSRLIRLAILVVSVVPLFYGVLYLWAFWDPYSRLDNMPVAVVNEDRGSETTGKNVNFGNELVDKLKTNNVLEWNFVGDEEAQTGMQSHKYFAEIKIPSDFSTKITSATTSDPEKANLIFIARESNSMIGAQLSNRVASQISDNLSHEVTKNYIDNIFIQTRESALSIQKAADGSSQLSEGLKQIQEGTNKLSNGSTSTYNGSSSLLVGLNQILVGGKSLNTGINQSYEGAKSLNDGIGQSAAGATTLADGSSKLKDGISQIGSGVNQLISNSTNTVSNLAIAQAYLADPNTVISDSSSPFNGMTKLQAASYIISNIVSQAQKPENSQQIAALQAGLAQTQQGADSLNTGLNSLSSALNSQIYPGSSKLVAGLQQLSSGSNSLSSGLADAVEGTESLSSGLAQLSSGSKDLGSGISSAKTGAEELGSQLSTGATEALQNSNVALTAKLAPMMSNPVTLSDESISKVANYGTGFSPYFIPLALWVGGLVIFLVIKINKKDIGIMQPRKYFLAKFVTLAKVGTIQAVILDLTLILLLGLRPLNYILFFVFSVLISWAFLAILELLIALLQDGGKFLGIVLLMLQLTSASGTYPVQTSPEFFQKINPYLPMTYAVNGLREIISGGNNQIIWSSFAVVATFTIIALVVITLFAKPIAKSKMDLSV